MFREIDFTKTILAIEKFIFFKCASFIWYRKDCMMNLTFVARKIHDGYLKL